MAIAHRVTPDAEPKLTRQTAFQPRWSALTRRTTEYRGYWLPTSFDNHGAIDEYWACREGAVVMDLSPLRKFEVVGPDAEALLQAAVTRNIRKLAEGQVVYTAMCNETGGMLDDATVFRLGADRFRFVGGDEHDGVWLRQLAGRLGLDQVWVKHSTDHLHNLAVQGPDSRDLLRDLVWTPPTQPRVRRPGLVPVRDRPDRRARRPAADRLAHRVHRRARLRAVVPSARRRGVVGRGMGGGSGLRPDAARPGRPGHAPDRVRADLRRVRVLRPGRPVRGRHRVHRAAEDEGRRLRRPGGLERRKAAPQRTLVGLELDGHETAGHGDCVHVGRSQVGVVTSGTRSPILRKNIALCRMAVEYAEIGTEVEVGKLDGHRKRIPAQVVRFPFYDPDKTRPRS